MIIPGRNKSICFITHYSGMYGANQSLCTLIIELKNNFNIKPVVIIKDEGAICDILKQNSINYYVTHFYWWVYSEKGVFQKLLNISKQFKNINRIKKIAKILKCEKIDLIYTNSLTINIGALLHKRTKIPHIWHLREENRAYNFKFSLGKHFAKKTFKDGADQYILISKYLLTDFQKYLPKNKIKIIYNGIPVNKSTSSKLHETNVVSLCIVGIVSEQKNQMDAVRAIKILMKEYFVTGIKLHIIGGAKEDYLNNILEYIHHEELEEYITYHGHVDNVHDLLSNMNIGLMCARDEAFGRVTVEYMLHRLPVIASDSGANPELVIPGISGDLYDLFDPYDLVDKIKNYLNNPELIRIRGNSAFEYAKTHFSSEINTREVYKVIEEVLSINEANKL